MPDIEALGPGMSLDWTIMLKPLDNRETARLAQCLALCLARLCAVPMT
jgi:hypothetical protein